MNLDEYYCGFNPKKTDSNDDGVTDKQEYDLKVYPPEWEGLARQLHYEYTVGENAG
jgi:hypothetical protein